MNSDTPMTNAFLRTANWDEAKKFCQRLEVIINRQREALECADECLALIEDVGHGAMSDNVTVARKIVQESIYSASSLA